MPSIVVSYTAKSTYRPSITIRDSFSPKSIPLRHGVDRHRPLPPRRTAPPSSPHRRPTYTPSAERPHGTQRAPRPPRSPPLDGAYEVYVGDSAGRYVLGQKHVEFSHVDRSTSPFSTICKYADSGPVDTWTPISLSEPFSYGSASSAQRARRPNCLRVSTISTASRTRGLSPVRTSTRATIRVCGRIAPGASSEVRTLGLICPLLPQLLEYWRGGEGGGRD